MPSSHAVAAAARRAGLLHKLPPENLTEAALDTLDVDRSEGAEDALTPANHFAYGAAGADRLPQPQSLP